MMDASILSVKKVHSRVGISSRRWKKKGEENKITILTLMTLADDIQGAKIDEWRVCSDISIPLFTLIQQQTQIEYKEHASIEAYTVYTYVTS
jgi:hypothetical protein